MEEPGLPFMLQLTLRPGTVYYFTHRDLSSPEPHYFIVLNHHPDTDAVLVLAVGSSKIDKIRRRRAGLPAETLVLVKPADYPDFTLETLIDCNQVFELPREELIAKYNERRIKSFRDLPTEILKLICQGVRLSPRVDETRKRLLPPEPQP